MFAITAKSAAAVETGAVGPGPGGGISPFQMRQGQAMAERDDRPYDQLRCPRYRRSPMIPALSEAHGCRGRRLGRVSSHDQRDSGAAVRAERTVAPMVVTTRSIPTRATATRAWLAGTYDPESPPPPYE